MHISSRSWPGAGLILALAGACGPVSPDSSATDANATDTTGQSTSTDQSTSTSPTTSTTSTTATTATTANDDTTGGTSLPGPTTGDDVTTGAETTGGTLPGLEDSCAAFCTAAFACFKPNPYPDLGSCGWACVAGFDPEQPACTAADSAVNACLGGLECPDLLEALASGEKGACGPEIVTQDEACPPRCQFGFLNGGSSACTISQTCPDKPATSYECSGDLCTCKVGDEVQAECPSAKVCGEGYEAWAAAANACCGFDY